MSEVMSFEVIRVSMWDGGDHHNFSHYLDNTPENAQWCKEQKHHISARIESILVFKTVAAHERFKSGEVKKRALAKLSPEERAALGV